VLVTKLRTLDLELSVPLDRTLRHCVAKYKIENKK